MLGGSPQATFNSIKAEKYSLSENGRGYFSVKETQNPYLPRTPGTHGVTFTFQNQMKESGSLWVGFVNLNAAGGAENRWLYCGNYKQVLSGEVSAAAFQDLPDHTKTEWYHALMKKQFSGSKPGWGAVAMDEAGMSQGERDVAGVERAFLSGRIRLPFYVLQCTSYDSALFQKLSKKNRNRPVTKGRTRRG